MDDLVRLRQQHKTKEILLNSTNWKYYDIGDIGSEFAVVFLHGTTDSKEIFWLPIRLLIT